MPQVSKVLSNFYWRKPSLSLSRITLEHVFLRLLSRLLLLGSYGRWRRQRAAAGGGGGPVAAAGGEVAATGGALPSNRSGGRGGSGNGGGGRWRWQRKQSRQRQRWAPPSPSPDPPGGETAPAAAGTHGRPGASSDGWRRRQRRVVAGGKAVAAEPSGCGRGGDGGKFLFMFLF